MDTNNIYNFFSIIERIQKEVFDGKELYYDKWLQTVGYESAPTNVPNEYIITSSIENNLTIDTINNNMSVVVRSVLNSNMKEILEVLNKMGLNPGETYSLLLRSPGYFYKVFSYTYNSYRVKF